MLIPSEAKEALSNLKELVKEKHQANIYLKDIALSLRDISHREENEDDRKYAYYISWWVDLGS